MEFKRNNKIWIEFCANHAHSKINPLQCKYIYLVKPNYKKVLLLKTIKDIELFMEKYKVNGSEWIKNNFINWDEVKKDYCGIEIYPFKKNKNYIWYKELGVSTFIAWNFDAFDKNTFKYFKFSELNSFL